MEFQELECARDSTSTITITVDSNNSSHFNNINKYYHHKSSFTKISRFIEILGKIIVDLADTSICQALIIFVDHSNNTCHLEVCGKEASHLGL